MGQIQTSVGLISGIPIEETVNQLIAISARPRDLLVSRTKQIEAEQLAVSQLTSLVLAVQFAANGLGDQAIFSSKSVTSTDKTLLSAVAAEGADPVPGSYQFTPVRRATAQQFVSSTFSAKDEPIGAGTLTLQNGGFLDSSVALDGLNGGEGVARGQIRIIDRSGATAVIDLGYAQTVDDVLDAINNNLTVNVSASVNGDALRLVDNTGQSTGNLIVQEVAGGTTAASLGLTGIDVAASEATGLDVYRLHENLHLDRLNDGAGVQLRTGLADLEITFSDGSGLSIDLGDADTLGDVLDAINAGDPARLSAQISADGDHLELTDLTSGGGTFGVASPIGGTAAEDLGLTESAAGGVITSRRLQAGLKTALLTSLGGGAGLELGTINLTDRSGANTSVDLSSAETIHDVIDLINAAGLGITASLNSSRSGIALADTSGGTGNLVVANADATNSADALGIAIDDAAAGVNGGSLNLQIVSPQTKLSALRGGEGVHAGSFIITDTNGAQGAVKLNTPGAELETIGDVIDAINALNIEVTARINDTGDGILLLDTAGGSQTLAVREVGSGTTAADLKFLGPVTTVDVAGTPTAAIDGTSRVTIDIGAEDTLEDLIAAINAADAGITAGTFFDGASYRLSLTGGQTGRDGEVLIDASVAGFSFQQIAKAQDALLLFGDAGGPNPGILLASSSGDFDGVIGGVNLTVEGESTDPVTINVTSTSDKLVKNINTFIEAYNVLRDTLGDLTFFNETDNTTGILFASNEALRVDTELANLLTGAFFGVGDFISLEAIGIEVDEEGQLSLNQEKLQAAFDDNPAGLEEFFTTEDIGVTAKLDALFESLAGAGGSLLTSRSESLADKIDNNNDRIAFLNARLETERQRLLTQFFQVETILAQMQSSLSAISGIAALPPLTFS